MYTYILFSILISHALLCMELFVLCKVPTCLSCCVLVGMSHRYAWIRLEDIFVCHGGHYIKLWHKGLGWKPGNTTSMTLTNHRSRPCKLFRNFRKGAFTMFAYEHPAILLVNTREHVFGDVTRGRGIMERPRRNITVLQLCYTIRPFARPWDFVGHIQII